MLISREEQKNKASLLVPFSDSAVVSRLTQLAYNDGFLLDLSPFSVALTGIFVDTMMSFCHRGTEGGDEFLILALRTEVAGSCLRMFSNLLRTRKLDMK